MLLDRRDVVLFLGLEVGHLVFKDQVPPLFQKVEGLLVQLLALEKTQLSLLRAMKKSV